MNFKCRPILRWCQLLQYRSNAEIVFHSISPADSTKHVAHQGEQGHLPGKNDETKSTFTKMMGQNQLLQKNL